jgi:hypothetical protein
MNENDVFSVTFERDMTLKYTDADGELKFTFEMGSSSRPKALYLYRKPFSSDFEELPIASCSQVRRDVAFNRTLDYLRSLQYDVDVIDE